MDFISGELFSNIADVSIYERNYLIKYPNIKKNTQNIIYYNEPITEITKKIITNSSIFFVKTDFIDFFQNMIMPLIKKKFILINHNSAYSSGNHIKIINNPLLIRWYGLNMKYHNKTQGIPLGLQNTQYPGSNFNICQQNRDNGKEYLLYFNFSNNTNPDRKITEDILIKNGFCKNKKVPWDEYISDLSKHKFCISPEGMGIDCHRIWESLYVNTIPIIKKNDILYKYFNDLPILWVENFNIITEDFLNSEYEKIKNGKYNIDKIGLKYWIYDIKKNLYNN